LELGFVDVDLMLSMVTPEQFEEWLAFGLYLEPFGSDVEWIKTGTVASMIYAANGGKGEGTQPADYIPNKKRKRGSVSGFQQMVAAKYGKDSKDGNGSDTSG
jgi:hypothetical protein